MEMNYLLDTTILIDMARGNDFVSRSIKSKLPLSQATPFITLLTYAEYYYGFVSGAPEEKGRCVSFLQSFDRLSLTEGSAAIFAELSYKYKKSGIAFSTMDMLNAAIAIEENMTLVTSDRFFEKINELKKIILAK